MIIAFSTSPSTLPSEMVAYFQACIDWGVQAATQYLAVFAGMTLVFLLFRK